MIKKNLHGINKILCACWSFRNTSHWMKSSHSKLREKSNVLTISLPDVIKEEFLLTASKYFYEEKWSGEINKSAGELIVGLWNKFSKPKLQEMHGKQCKELVFRSVKPLIPKSDWPLISPFRITLKLNVKVMRILEMITNLRSSWFSNKFSLSVPQEMLRDQCGDYEY